MLGDIVQKVEDLFNGIRDFLKTKFAGVSIGEFLGLGMFTTGFTALYSAILQALGLGTVMANPLGAAGVLALGAYSGVKGLQAIGRNDLVSMVDENRAFFVAFIAGLAIGAIVLQTPAFPMAGQVAQTVIASVFP